MTGKRDRYINVDPGLVFGVFATNLPHALLHIAYGLLGLAARRSPQAARGYMGLGGALFAFLGTAGWLKVPDSPPLLQWGRA